MGDCLGCHLVSSSDPQALIMLTKFLAVLQCGMLIGALFWGLSKQTFSSEGGIIIDAHVRCRCDWPSIRFQRIPLQLLGLCDRRGSGTKLVRSWCFCGIGSLRIWWESDLGYNDFPRISPGRQAMASYLDGMLTLSTLSSPFESRLIQFSRHVGGVLRR